MKSATNQRLVLLSAALLSAWVSLGVFFYVATKSGETVLSSSTSSPSSTLVPTSQPTVSLSPATVYGAPGTTFTEVVVLDSGPKRILGAVVELRFNPTILEVTRITLLSQDFLSLMQNPAIDTSTGKVTFSVNTGSTTNLFTGTTSLAEIEFKIKTSSNSQEKITFAPSTYLYTMGDTTAITSTTIPATVTTSPIPTTPSITPSLRQCRPELASFSVDTSCGNNSFRFATYTCLNGKTQKDGSSASCKSIETWVRYGREFCQKALCPVSPTPPPRVTPRIKCSTNAQCSSGTYCTNGLCTPNTSKCTTKADCPASYECYQPPMPVCPVGSVCPQVMPTKYCRIPPASSASPPYAPVPKTTSYPPPPSLQITQ